MTSNPATRRPSPRPVTWPKEGAHPEARGTLRTQVLNAAVPYVLEVYDEADSLVCWCGPYTQLQWKKAVKLFVDAGWTNQTYQPQWRRQAA